MRFNNRRTEYRGQVYDSADEAARAAMLELLRMAGKIERWERGAKQSLIDLGPGKRVTYKPDFIVIGKEGQRWAEDVKGTKNKDGRTVAITVTREFRIKALLWETRFPNLPLRVVNRDGDIIWPAPRPPRKSRRHG